MQIDTFYHASIYSLINQGHIHLDSITTGGWLEAFLLDSSSYLIIDSNQGSHSANKSMNHCYLSNLKGIVIISRMRESPKYIRSSERFLNQLQGQRTLALLAKSSKRDE